jgi:hypothetical protein
MSEAAQEARKQASTVVTSENLAEFSLAKLGLASDGTPIEAAPAEPVVETEASEPSETEAATGEKKQNPKLEKRFSELTKQREAARQEAERERQARQELENRIKELETKANPAKAAPADPDPKPDPSQFNDALEYAEALAEWTTDKRLRERDEQEMSRKAQEEQSRKQVEFQKRVETAKANLADNPDYARSLAEKSLTAQLREIGKLEAKFEKTATPSKKEPVAKKSNAPAPISPIKASSSAVETGLDSDRAFHGTYQQWKAARLAGKIR